MIRGDGFAIIPPDDPPAGDASGGASISVKVGAETGCRNLVQRIIHLPAGSSLEQTHPASEEVAYVAAGIARIETGKDAVQADRGTAFLIPPGTAHHLSNATGAGTLIVSVLSPPPGGRPVVAGHPPIATVREADEEPLPAGDDRTFKLLIDPRHGCRNVTQFAGFIRRSRAPFHTHTYEEVIYVLDGAGILHAGDERVPFVAGTSIFLSPDTPHCLENAREATLRLLGVFSPAGSPAGKRGGGPA